MVNLTQLEQNTLYDAIQYYHRKCADLEQRCAELSLPELESAWIQTQHILRGLAEKFPRV